MSEIQTNAGRVTLPPYVRLMSWVKPRELESSMHFNENQRQYVSAKALTIELWFGRKYKVIFSVTLTIIINTKTF